MIEKIGAIRVHSGEGGVVVVNAGGEARLSPHAALRVAESLVRAAFRTVLSEEIDATSPRSTGASAA